MVFRHTHSKKSKYWKCKMPESFMNRMVESLLNKHLFTWRRFPQKMLRSPYSSRTPVGPQRPCRPIEGNTSLVSFCPGSEFCTSKRGKCDDSFLKQRLRLEGSSPLMKAMQAWPDH